MLIFTRHLQNGSFKTLVFHGQNRISTELLGQYDIIITTYHTVAAIWRNQDEESANEKSIFSLIWHRVVLDEGILINPGQIEANLTRTAHIIRNPQSQLIQACCALRAERRWAITGTPIQNNLQDFASIIKFLRVHPYHDDEIFKEEIVRPWQNRHATFAEGFLRLKSLTRSITLSRTKNVLKLPPRTDEVHYLNFTSAERELYNATKSQSEVRLEEAISSGNQSRKISNALLHLLLKLRLICNQGLLVQSTCDVNSIQPQDSTGGYSAGDVHRSLDDDLLDGTAFCPSCGANILSDILEGSQPGLASTTRRSEPGQIFCESCVSQISEGDPSDRSLQIDRSEISAPGTTGSDSDVTSIIEFMSTKIKALVADLHKYNLAEKRFES
jgi:SNF2 family DNA or RNA helicase